MAKVYAAGPELDTAYRGTRDEWAGLLGASQAQAREHRRIILAMAVMLALSVAGMYLLAQRPVLVYAVESDAIGQVAVRGTFAREFKPSDLNIRFHLKQLVEMVRQVTADPAYTAQKREESFWFATKRARAVLTDYYTKAGSPGTLAKQGTRVIEVTDVLKVTEGTWQVDWLERPRDLQGNAAPVTGHRVSFRVLIHPPKDKEQLERNPSGIYVDELNWIELRRVGQ